MYCLFVNLKYGLNDVFPEKLLIERFPAQKEVRIQLDLFGTVPRKPWVKFQGQFRRFVFDAWGGTGRGGSRRSPGKCDLCIFRFERLFQTVKYCRYLSSDHSHDDLVFFSKKKMVSGRHETFEKGGFGPHVNVLPGVVKYFKIENR